MPKAELSTLPEPELSTLLRHEPRHPDSGGLTSATIPQECSSKSAARLPRWKRSRPASPFESSLASGKLTAVAGGENVKASQTSGSPMVGYEERSFIGMKRQASGRKKSSSSVL